MGLEKTYIPPSRPWECGNLAGISKECGKGGKPVSWLSMLSILCHFHGLFLPDDVDVRAIPSNSVCRSRHEHLPPWVDECLGDLH